MDSTDIASGLVMHGPVTVDESPCKEEGSEDEKGEKEE